MTFSLKILWLNSMILSAFLSPTVSLPTPRPHGFEGNLLWWPIFQYSHIAITSQSYGQTHPIPVLLIIPAKNICLIFLPKECFISGWKKELIMINGQPCRKSEIRPPRNNEGNIRVLSPQGGSCWPTLVSLWTPGETGSSCAFSH